MRTFCEAMDNDFSFAMNALHQQGFVTHSNLITHAANALRGIWETDGAIDPHHEVEILREYHCNELTSRDIKYIENYVNSRC